MSEIAEIFATNLRRFRKAAGLTQEQMAEAVGVSFTAVQAWEASRRWPGIENIATIAKVLGVEQDKLFADQQREPATISSLMAIIKDQEDRLASPPEDEVSGIFKRLTRTQQQHILELLRGLDPKPLKKQKKGS